MTSHLTIFRRVLKIELTDVASEDEGSNVVFWFFGYILKGSVLDDNY